MGEPEFTPGPWLPLDGGRGAYALDETGGVNRFSCHVQGGYQYCGRTVQERTSEAELNANARLIAAAPELCEALAVLVAQRRCTHNPAEAVEAAYSAARAALAKVRGDV